MWTYDLASRAPVGFYAYRVPRSAPQGPDGRPAHKFGLVTYKQLSQGEEEEEDSSGFVHVSRVPVEAQSSPPPSTSTTPQPNDKKHNRWDPRLLKKLEATFGILEAGLESRVRRSEALDFRVADCVLASSVAPTLLPPARVQTVGSDELRVFSDGGISADSPALEAFNLLRDGDAEAGPDARTLELGECVIFSLGTMAVVDLLPAQEAASLKSPLAWARSGDLVDTLVNANPEVVHGYLERFYASGGPELSAWYLRVQVTADRRKMVAFAPGSKGHALERGLVDFDKSGPEEMRALREMAELVGELNYP